MNKLQKSLKANALFSSISGILMIICNHQLANLFGTTNSTVFWVIGFVLIYFAGTIGYEITKQRKLAVWWIIIQDYTWVLGSIILMILNPFQITMQGNLLIGAVALVVLYMGVRQMNALNKTTSKTEKEL